MRGRESERISFYSQKRLKTDGDTNEEQAEITETEIFMKFKLWMGKWSSNLYMMNIISVFLLISADEYA